MAEATGHGLDGPSPAADSPASRVDSSILLQNSREPGRHAEIFVLTRALYTVGLMFYKTNSHGNRVVIQASQLGERDHAGLRADGVRVGSDCAIVAEQAGRRAAGG